MTTKHDEIREQLQQLMALIRPYAQSTGPFADMQDVRAAIGLGTTLLHRAEVLSRDGAPTP